MRTTLLEAARQGYTQTGPSPHPSDSRLGTAWAIGAWLNATGRTSPRHVASARGGRFAVNDMTVSVTRRDGSLTIARES